MSEENNEELKNTQNVKKNNKILSDQAVFNTRSNIGGYGEANYHYIRSYTGVLNGQKEVVQKGLKHLHKHKVNKDNLYSNRKSNAGFAAEIDEVSKRNASFSIKGSKVRIHRANDVGRGNDQIYDLVYTDKSGRIITDSDGRVQGYQMKIKGRYDGDEKIGGKPLPSDLLKRQMAIEKSYDNLINELTNSKNERYLDAGVAVGSEQYAYIKEECNSKYKELMDKTDSLKKEGKLDKAAELEAKAKRTKRLGDNLVKAQDSSKEAMEAYMHPKMQTAKRVIKTSVSAGVQHATYASVMSSVSVGINGIVSVTKGDMSLNEAIEMTAKETAKSAAISFAVGAGDSMVKGCMANSKHTVMQHLSQSNMPMKIVVTTRQLSGSVKRLITGEMTEKEFLQEIGSQQAGVLAASWGGALGAASVGTASNSLLLATAGAAAGSTIALLIFSSLYQAAMDIYAEEDASIQRRKEIEEFCREAKVQIKQQQERLKESIKGYEEGRQEVFISSIGQLDLAFSNNDSTQFVEALSKIAIEMGKSLQFKSFDEFNEFMLDDSSILEL